MIAGLFALFSVRVGAVIDVVADNKSGAFVEKIIACLIVLAGWFLASLIFSYIKSIYASSIIKDTKKELYSSINRKEMSAYVENPNEYYLNILTRNIDLLSDNYLLPKCEIIQNLISAIVSIATIFIINWKLGISFIGVSLFTMVFSQLPGVLMAKKTQEFSNRNAEYLKVINNHLKGFEQIKLLGVSDLFFKKYLEKDNEFEKSRFGYIFTSKFANTLGIFFSFFAQVACMGIGIWFVMKGDLTVGLLISAINLLNGVFNPIQQFAQNKNLMGTVKDIMKAFDGILATEAESGKEIEGKISEIKISNLDLSFPDGKQIFNNYNTEFKANNKYAIVGESGRGKSTLIKLIMKYYDKESFKGEIYLNGEDTCGILSKSLYKKIAYIQRNDFYVDGTVRDNIELYREIPPNEELYNKLKFKSVFLEKSIEEGSRNQVSTGEKQRIDIARFLIKDYDVLIFDEPTSNLDKETSEIIFDLIFGIKDKIVIVITHEDDESILSQFDEVVRL